MDPGSTDTDKSGSRCLTQERTASLARSIWSLRILDLKAEFPIASSFIVWNGNQRLKMHYCQVDGRTLREDS